MQNLTSSLVGDASESIELPVVIMEQIWKSLIKTYTLDAVLGFIYAKLWIELGS